MGVKMSKRIFLVTIILVISLIGGMTLYKIRQIHHAKLLLVSKKYIEEQAQKCYNEKKCQKDIVTLQELENLNYLNNEVNPVTKEYYNKNSYLKKEGDNYFLVIID